MQTTTDIRDILMKQIEEISSGKGDLKVAKAVSELSAQAIYATRLELENKRTELELGKSTEEVKKWMSRDFSNIQNIKVGG